MATATPSKGALLRAARIKAGKCASCGKRKPVKGLRDCQVCRTYYKDYAKKHPAKKSA